MGAKLNHEKLLKKIDSLQKAITRHRRREAVLWQNQERLTQIIESIPIPTFVIDNDHVVTHYNSAMENLTGIAVDEMVGTREPWKAFYAAARPTMADLIVNGASEEQIVELYQGKFNRSLVKDGAYEAEDFFSDIGEKGKWLFFTAAPLTDSDGNIFGAVETLQDVTERNIAEAGRLKSEGRFRTLLDIAPYSILVFNVEGHVTYLNPAFAETFGWTLNELRGRRIQYVPTDLKTETAEQIKQLLEEKVIRRYETKRLTKDGRILDVVWRASVISDANGRSAGVLVILRDITRVKRIARNNEAMLRISMELPEYLELYEVLDYVSRVIKELMVTEGGLVILLDEQRQELFLRGAAFDNTATQLRAKEVRFSVDELIAGTVIRTGKPILMNDIAGDDEIHKERDRKLGYRTRNLLLVPLKSQDHIIGTLCAVNKKEGGFDQSDVELLSMLAGTVVLSIENARFSAELKKAYMEVSSLNRAKDKVINHLSHELKTPIAVLRTSLVILEKRLKDLPQESWQPTIARASKNLDRLLEMQYQIEDIMQDKTYKPSLSPAQLLDQSADELETLIAEQIGESQVVERIRKRLNARYGMVAARDLNDEIIHLDKFVRRRLEALKPLFDHRQVKISEHLADNATILMPSDPLRKLFDGLIRNAVENTPDEGKIEVVVKQQDGGALLEVRDFGVGISKENQARIFEGFFTTQETMAYSSKRPFDFNAGGKGADLLRMRIFSERHNFKIALKSSRCPFLSKPSDSCPGSISLCPRCKEGAGCHQAAATIFSVFFPPAR
jgi:PAS domain S-box-containing protein